MSVVDKVIVFDLDETLGYFQDFGILWNSLQIKYSDKQTTNKQTTNKQKKTVSFDNNLFNSLIDLYPNLLRPKIIDILEMIVKYQSMNELCPFLLMIYTNNNGGKEWVKLIINYFESKIAGLHFDRIINAFKINDEIIEPSRTGYEKKYSDFLKTTKMPKKTKICFIDDTFHPQMENDNIVYLHIKPYIYDLDASQFLGPLSKHNVFGANGFIDNETLGLLKLNLGDGYKNENNSEKKSALEKKVDIIVSKQLKCFLHEFIFESRDE